MRRFLYDTAVFVYAVGREHQLRDPCRAIVGAAADGELVGEATADLPQELANHRLRRTGDRKAAAEAARYVMELCVIHPVTADDAVRALELFEAHPGLDAMDALSAAVALGNGLDAILSPDRAFDDVPGLSRVDPADRAAVDALAA